MDYGAQSFPFNIADVATLLNLRVRHKQSRSMDVNCPFCGDKRGKMNINFEKNVFRCNYCGEYGGMVAMYAKVYGISNADAYHEICEALRTGTAAPEYEAKKQKACSTPPVLNAELASLEEMHQTYSLLFSMLTLSNLHKQQLMKRGLSEEQIKRYGYKSTPAFGFTKLTARLMDQGCTVKGVPGFYINENGEWTVNFHSKCSGIVIPAISIDGRISAAQIRLDRPFNNRKYLWLSSINKKMGTSSGSPVHFVGNPADKVVYITEGPLKATVAHCLSGKSFASVAGANQYSNLAGLFSVLKQNGTEMIAEAYDMDKYENEYVAKGCLQLFSLANDFGFKIHRIKWNKAYKGVDDYLYALYVAKEIGNK